MFLKKRIVMPIAMALLCALTYTITSTNGVLLDTPAFYMSQASVDFDAVVDKLECIAALKMDHHVLHWARTMIRLE